MFVPLPNKYSYIFVQFLLLMYKQLYIMLVYLKMSCLLAYIHASGIEWTLLSITAKTLIDHINIKIGLCKIITLIRHQSVKIQSMLASNNNAVEILKNHKHYISKHILTKKRKDNKINYLNLTISRT